MDFKQIEKHLEILFDRLSGKIEIDFTVPNQPKNFNQFAFLSVDKVIDFIKNLPEYEHRSFAVHPNTKKEFGDLTKKTGWIPFQQKILIVDIDSHDKDINITDYLEIKKKLPDFIKESIKYIAFTGRGFQFGFLVETLQGKEEIENINRAFIDLISKYVEIDTSSKNTRKGQRLIGTINPKYGIQTEFIEINNNAKEIKKSELHGLKAIEKFNKSRQTNDNIIKEIKKKLTFFDVFPELKDNIVSQSFNRYDLLCPIHPERNPSASIYELDEHQILVDFHPQFHKEIEYPDFIYTDGNVFLLDVIDLYRMKYKKTLKEAIKDLSKIAGIEYEENINELSPKEIASKITDVFVFTNSSKPLYVIQEEDEIFTATKEKAEEKLIRDYEIEKKFKFILANLKPVKKLRYNPNIPFGYNEETKEINTFRNNKYIHECKQTTSKSKTIYDVSFDDIQDETLKAYFKNLLAGNEEYLKVLLAFFTLKLNGKKVGISPILTTNQGIGKSSILPEFMKSLNFDIKQISQTQLFSKYTDHLENVYITFVEEMHVEEKHSIYEQYKNWITEKEIIIEKKYMPKYTVENFNDFIGFSNNKTPVLVKEQNERRFIILENFNGRLLSELKDEAGYRDFEEYRNHLISSFIEFVENVLFYVDDISCKEFLENYAIKQNETIKNEILKETNPIYKVVEDFQEIDDFIMDDDASQIEAVRNVKSGICRTQDIAKVLELMGYKYTAIKIGRFLNQLGIRQVRINNKRYYVLDKEMDLELAKNIIKEKEIMGV